MTESAPFSNPWLQWQRAALDQAFAALGRVTNFPTLWERAKRIRKGVSASEVVYEEDRLKLLHYRSDCKSGFKTPLVFIYALVNRPYILDLKKGRSVVANFVNQGFDTYLVDWGMPTPADRHLTLDDYINGYMANVMDYLSERTGAQTLNVLGYCMGGTMSAMFTALHPKRVNNLILLAAPIDFSSNDSLLNLWTRPEHFDVDKFVDTFGNCPRQFVKYLYQQNLLTQNRMPVGKRIVNLQNITCPVLNIMAGKDDLVPCSQGMPFTDLVGSKDRKTILLDGSGHIGLAIGGRAQKEVWPQACEWLAQRSD